MNLQNENIAHLIDLENGSTKIDYDKLEKLILSKDSELRSRCAEILAWFPTDKSEYLLKKLLYDSDPMVRANACDSISFSRSQNVFPVLQKLMFDNNYLVRGYAVLSYADICNNIRSNKIKNEAIGLFVNLLKQETDDWVLLLIHKALVLLGQWNYLPKLLSNLDNQDYRLRICTIHCLDELNLADPYLFQVTDKLRLFLAEEKIDFIKKQAEDLLEKISK